MLEYGKKVWKDGEISDWQSGGNLSLLTHTLHYGVGAFEGIRAYQRARGETAIFRLREHIDRLFDSCHLVLMKPTVTREQVVQGCVDVLRENKMAQAYLRPIALIADGAMGVYAPKNPVAPTSRPGSGAPISDRKRSRRASAAWCRRSRGTTSTWPSPRASWWASTSTA